MELGVEIGQKIRSAIKSKLVELGAYVDEELPDYIMVMVANRKSHEQMNKDLGLFLGPNTNMFTSWLHGILDRLRSLTTPEMTQNKARKEKGESSREGYKEDGRGSGKEGRKTTERERGKDSRRDGGRDKARNWRDRDRSELSSCTIRGEPSREQCRDVKDRGKDLRRDPKELVKVSPVSSIPVELDKENQIMATTTLDRGGPHALEHGAFAQPLNLVPSESVIDLKPEPDDFIDDFDSVNKLQQMDRPVDTTVPVQTLSSPSLLSPSGVSTATGTTRAAPSEGKKNPSSHQHETAGTEIQQTRQCFSNPPSVYVPSPTAAVGSCFFAERSTTLFDRRLPYQICVKEDNQQCNMQMLGMSSVIRIGVVRGEAGVQRHWQTEVLDEEDEENEDESFARGLHSSVQVAPKLERRPSLPPNKQANKNLLLRAINEAQQSIANINRLQQARKRQFVVPRARPREECNAKRWRTEDMAHGLGNVITHHEERITEQHGTKMAIREQGMRSAMNVGQQAEDHHEQNLYMAPATQQGVSQIAGAMVGGKVRDTRSFILTQQQYQNQHQASTMVADAVPALVPVMGPVSTPVTLQHLKTHSAEQVSRPLPMIVEGDGNPKATRVVHGRDASSYQTVTPKFIVTLDGAMEQETSSADIDPPDVEMCFDDLELMDEDEQEEIVEDEGQLFVQASDGKLVRLPTLKPVALALGGSDSKMLEQNAVGRRAVERCRFWPGCANGDSCSFHHPSQQCRLFPNCKFGDRCLYIHPNCRFDGQCMKTNCPYTHASRRAYTMPAKPVVEQLRVQPMQCKFFPECKKPDCTFYHPKPCRYGSCCKRSDCSFFHPEVSLPPREALRWVKSQQLSQ